MQKIFFLICLFSSINLYSQQNNVPYLVKNSLSSVVLITTDYSSGSGVVVNTEGVILTNFHVVSSVLIDNSVITVKTHNNDLYIATILSYDEDLDICLIKTENLVNEKSIFIAHQDSINLGEDVICIGNPLGLTEYVTKGIISKYNTPYIFTSASINPGNSGGAMINMKGELVGIPTQTITNTQNVNMALCIRTIRYFLKKNKINFKEYKL